MAAVLRCACVLIVLPAAGCMRQEASNLDAGQGSHGAAAKDEFRIFAATWNAANLQTDKMGEKVVRSLMPALTDGHEDAGQEADMVILGLQEFDDKDSTLGKMAAGSFLWQSLSKKKMQEVEEKVQRVLAVPPEVTAAKHGLHQDFVNFHKRMERQVGEFRESFGESGKQFHEHLGAHSGMAWWMTGGQSLNKDMNSMLKKGAAQQHDFEDKHAEDQYRPFKDAAELLRREMGTSPDPAHIRSRLKPVHAWIDKAVKEVGRIRREHPSLAYTGAGERAWRSLVEGLATSGAVEEGLINGSSQHAALESAVGGLQRGVQDEVKSWEKLVSNTLEGDLSRISKALSKFSADLNALVLLGKRDAAIESKASLGAKPWEHKLDGSVKEWAARTEQSFKELLQPASFRMDATHIEVKRTTQKFAAGTMCNIGGHFDTLLHVYVNPWSGWKVRPVPYHSTTCAQHEGYSGCSIDNIQKYECGKVVNFLVFEARKAQKSIKVCAMNTHMSFAGTARQRFAYMAKALKEARLAYCDTLTFVGDFNSRLHCTVEGDAEQVAPYHRLDPDTNSSLRYLVDRVCRGGTCALRGLESSVLYYDELMQFMDQDTISCIEERKERTGMFRVEKRPEKDSVQNSLKTTGVFEAGVPDWEPTYGIGTKAESQEVAPEWAHCLTTDGAREPTCFINHDKRGKHNFGWTDRILLWPYKGAKATPRATEYSRRFISPAVGSDHAPVVAKVTVNVP